MTAIGRGFEDLGADSTLEERTAECMLSREALAERAAKMERIKARLQGALIAGGIALPPAIVKLIQLLH